MVPHTTGLLVPSPTSGRGPAWERRSLLKKVCILDPTQDGSRLGAEEEDTVTAGWQPPPHTHNEACSSYNCRQGTEQQHLDHFGQQEHACMHANLCMSLSRVPDDDKNSGE